MDQMRCGIKKEERVHEKELDALHILIEDDPKDMDALRGCVLFPKLTAAMWSLASLSILKRRCSEDIVYFKDAGVLRSRDKHFYVYEVGD